MDVNTRTLQCHDLTRGCDDDCFREDEIEDYPNDFQFEDELNIKEEEDAKAIEKTG